MTSTDRKVEVSTQLSVTVYEFEKGYTEVMNTQSFNDAVANGVLKLNLPPHTTLVDSYYDQDLCFSSFF